MKDNLKYLSLVTQVGLSIVIGIGLFAFLGLYLDRRFHTRATFTVVFLLIGSLSAVWSAYKLIVDAMNSNGERK